MLLNLFTVTPLKYSIDSHKNYAADSASFLKSLFLFPVDTTDTTSAAAAESTPSTLPGHFIFFLEMYPGKRGKHEFMKHECSRTLDTETVD